jgi:hypothetical protein
MLEPSTFRYEEAPDGVATITLNRPDRLNALTFEVYAELRDLFARSRITIPSRRSSSLARGVGSARAGTWRPSSASS